MFGLKKRTEGSVRVIEIREGRAEIFIEAPPTQVWDAIGDVRNYGKWAKFFKAVVPEGMERIEKPGDWIGYETTILGVPLKGKVVTVERVPPVRSAFYLLSAYRGGGEYLLEPKADGTEIHYTIWSEIPSSYLGKAIDSALLADRSQQQMEEHLVRLKAYVEGLTLT